MRLMAAEWNPEPTMGRPAGAAEFRRDILPAGAGGQDEPDHTDDDPVSDTGPTALGTAGLLGREMMGDRLEELVRHMGGGHGGSLLDGGSLPNPGAKPMPVGFVRALYFLRLHICYAARLSSRSAVA